MATPISVSDFFTELDELTLNKFRNTTNTQKLRYLNRALLSLHTRIKNLLHGSFDKSTPVTASNGVISLPDDMIKDDTTDWALFRDEQRSIRIATADIRYEADTLRLGYNSSDTLYLEYTREPNRYTDVSTTMEETASIRALEMLQTEVEYLRDIDIRQGQTSGQAQSARVRTQEVS